jgi:quinol monooxygenase YgiN
MRMIVKRLVKEGKTDELIKIYEELIAKTREEDGCILYSLCRDEKNPRLFAMMEEWRDQEALDRHLQTEHFKALVPKLNEITEIKYDAEKYIPII